MVALLERGTRAADRCDRPLYHLYTGTGDSIDAALIREGLGRAWTRDGQHTWIISRA